MAALLLVLSLIAITDLSPTFALRCPLLAQRTYRVALHMSAFGGKADIGWIAAILALCGHFGDSDVADVARLAMAGLIQTADVADLAYKSIQLEIRSLPNFRFYLWRKSSARASLRWRHIRDERCVPNSESNAQFCDTRTTRRMSPHMVCYALSCLLCAATCAYVQIKEKRNGKRLGNRHAHRREMIPWLTHHPRLRRAILL